MSNTAHKALLPFSIIKAATEGDITAINHVVNHYQRYINALSTRRLYDENGNEHFYIDEEIQQMLKIKLISKILDFRLVRPA